MKTIYMALKPHCRSVGPQVLPHDIFYKLLIYNYHLRTIRHTSSVELFAGLNLRSNVKFGACDFFIFNYLTYLLVFQNLKISKYKHYCFRNICFKHLMNRS